MSLSQPSAARIRVLEEELGVVLFKRAHRALKLTPAG
jgi:DNA-binding transcriptional LysR family regulator